MKNWKLCVCIFFLLLQGCQEDEQEKYMMYTVQKKDIELTIEKDGFLTPHKRTTIRSPHSRPISWIISEGKMVKKGDLLLELEYEYLRNRMLKYQTRVMIFRAEISRVRATCNRRLNVCKNNLLNAKSQLELAKLNLKNAQTGASIDELEKIGARFGLKEAIIQFRTKHDKFLLGKELVGRGVESEENLEDLKTEAKIAQLGRKKARLMLKRILEGATTYDLQELRLVLLLAQYNLTNSRKYLRSERKRTKKIMKRYKARMKRLQRRTKKIRKILREMAVHAPSSGYVLSQKYNGQKIVAGMQASKGHPVLSIIPRSSKMKIIVKVERHLITKIQKGQKAKIFLVGEKTPFKGKILKINDLPRDEFQDYDHNTKNLIGKAKKDVFDVTILLNEENPKLFPGLRAKVKIYLSGTEKNILACPNFAIQEKTVYVKTPKGISTRKIVLGRKNDYFTEIRQGIKEGEKIVWKERK